MRTVTEKRSWYSLPSRPKVSGYVHSAVHDDIVSYVTSYGALTLPMLYWLMYSEPLTQPKVRDKDRGIKQDTRYRLLARYFQTLADARAIKRSKGLRGITYGIKSIGQNHHWLDRSWMHMTVEFFCSTNSIFIFEWENEREVRRKPGVADAKLYLGKQRPGEIQESRFRIEIDRGNKEPWQLREQLLAHINLYREYRDKYRGTPDFHPWRILFATNNRRNILPRILRDMKSVEESKTFPNFILYTDQSRYSPATPDSLICEPIWQTAHSEEYVSNSRSYPCNMFLVMSMGQFEHPLWLDASQMGSKTGNMAVSKQAHLMRWVDLTREDWGSSS